MILATSNIRSDTMGMFWKVFIGFIRVVVIPLGAVYMIYILVMAAISIVHDEKKKKK